MIDSIVNLVKGCRIFSSLDLEICQSIAHLFEPMELEEGDILFRQDDPPHYVYILTHGSLVATVLTANGGKFVGTIECGETVGELGAISGDARTLTIKANQHSKLIRLTSAEFTKLCHHYPSIMLETIKPIITRSQTNIRLLSNEKECRYVAVIIQKNDPNIPKIKKNIQKNLPKNPNYTFLVDSQVDSKNCAKILAEEAKKHQCIIAVLDSGDTALSRLIIDKCENLFILADADMPKSYDPYTNLVVNDQKNRKRIKFELILVHNNKKEFPHNTKLWLNEGLFSQHHHLRIDNDSDYSRLLRFLSGNAIGLVLGGGGSRGWLQIGVIKALIEANIPIDAVGGTSVGSIVSGCYLTGQGVFEKIFEKFSYINDKSAPPFTLRDYTLPVISLMNSERVTNSLKHICDEQNIEDLWQPFFCISSNVTTHKEHTHHSGSLFEKTRASMAIPGLLPPMVINGQLHYDGALCNNLPVDIMRNIVGTTGKIIAVGLNCQSNANKEYNFPPILTAADITAKKFHLSKNNYIFPPFFDTFYDVLTFGSSTREKENAAFADILISPDLSNYSMLGLKKQQESELLRLGYKYLVEALGSWKFDTSKSEFIKK